METEILKVDASRPDLDGLQRAARRIDAGELVAFPTETVYGIACRTMNDTVERLTAVKGRGTEKYYTLHIGQKSDLSKYVPQVGAVAGQLIRKAWPGPLTIVFMLTDEEIALQREALGTEYFWNLYRDNSIGVRCPDDVIASLLLSYAQRPVVASSANMSGEPAAVSGTEAYAKLKDRIELIVDGGECKYGKGSTVVRVGKGGLTILREGVYDHRDIEAMSQIQILFVCTGNTCRSPMAAGLCRKYLAQKLGCGIDQVEKMGYKIVSAGVGAIAGRQVSPEAMEVCHAKGVDIAGHRTTPLSARLIEQSDYIFVMCEHHRQSIAAMYSGAVEKCSMLDDRDIPDPIGGSEKEYYYCAELIEKALQKKIGELVP